MAGLTTDRVKGNMVSKRDTGDEGDMVDEGKEDTNENEVRARDGVRARVRVRER